MNSDFIDGIGAVASFLPQWFVLGVAISILAGLLFCIYRAKSFDFLLDRAWIFFGGSKEFNEKSLNDEWNVIRDLELYRYRYRFPFNSISEINSLRIWLKENDISTIDLRKISDVFNFEKLETVSKDFLFEKISLSIIALFVAIFAWVGVYIGLQDESYFVVVDTEQRFFFDGKTIKIQDNIFKRSQCNKIRNNPYPDFEVDKDLFNKYMACEMFTPDGKNFYEKTISEQRLVGGFSIIIFSIVFSYIVRRFVKYNVAIRINNKLEKNKIKLSNLVLTNTSNK